MKMRINELSIVDRPSTLILVKDDKDIITIYASALEAYKSIPLHKKQFCKFKIIRTPFVLDDQLTDWIKL